MSCGWASHQAIHGDKRPTLGPLFLMLLAQRQCLLYIDGRPVTKLFVNERQGDSIRQSHAAEWCANVNLCPRHTIDMKAALGPAPKEFFWSWRTVRQIVNAVPIMSALG